MTSIPEYNSPQPRPESPITARVQYFGPIGLQTRRSEETVEMAGAPSVHDLLWMLSGRYGEDFGSEIFLPGSQELREDLIIAVNGNVVRHGSTFATCLRPGDTVALFPIFPGGG